jgi:hypothetical protein
MLDQSSEQHPKLPVRNRAVGGLTFLIFKCDQSLIRNGASAHSFALPPTSNGDANNHSDSLTTTLVGFPTVQESSCCRLYHTCNNSILHDASLLTSVIPVSTSTFQHHAREKYTARQSRYTSASRYYSSKDMQGSTALLTDPTGPQEYLSPAIVRIYVPEVLPADDNFSSKLLSYPASHVAHSTVSILIFVANLSIMDCDCSAVFVNIITRTINCMRCGKCWALAWVCFDLHTALCQCHPLAYRVDFQQRTI